MNENGLKKYFYAAACLFGAIAASIILFFVLDKWDGIAKGVARIITKLMPFVIGALLAYIICPLCNMFEKLYAKALSRLKDAILKEKIIRTMSVLSGIVIALITVYLILMILIPQLIASVMRMVQIIPAGVDNLWNNIQSRLNSNETVLKYSQQVLDKLYGMVEDWLSNSLLDSVENIATGVSTGVISIISVVLNIFIGVIVAVYLLFSRKKLAKQANLIIHSVFKKKTADIIVDEIKYADKVFSGFINGKIVDAVIISLICYLGLMVFKLFNPGSITASEVLVAVIVGIFNVIPFFGWYIGLFLSAILILIINPAQCVFFVIFDIILQQIDGNIIGPKILGNTTGISSLWVLFSIFFFGEFWGFAGMLFGVPLFAVIYHWIKCAVFIGLKKKGQEALIDAYERDYPNKSEETKKNAESEMTEKAIAGPKKPLA